MADSKARILAHAADPAPPPLETAQRREPMLPEIEVEGCGPAQDVQPTAEADAGSAAPAAPRPQPQDAHDLLAALKSLSEAELIALFS